MWAREDVLNLFMDVIVATGALGLGIDMPNICAVFYMGMLFSFLDYV